MCLNRNKLSNLNMKRIQSNGHKLINGRKIPKEMTLKVDTSPEHMKKVNERFKWVEKFRLPYSGIELQRRARVAKRITGL